MIELNFDPHAERIERAHCRLEAAYRCQSGHQVPVVEPYVCPDLETTGEDCPFNRARKKLAFFVDVNDIAQGDEYRGRYKEHYAEYVIPRLRTGDLTGCILQSCGCPPTAGLDDLNEALAWTRQQISATL